MAKFVRSLAAVLLFGVVGACAPTNTQIDYRYLNPSYNHQNFNSYLQGRDTRVVVVGDMLGLEPEAFGNAVTADMQGNNEGGPTNFTTHPTNAEPNFRVVMAFNAASYSNSLCEVKDLRPQKTAGMTTLQAAWCWDNRMESYVSGRVAAVNPSDPKFKSLIAATTRELFPQHMDPILQDDDFDSGDNFP